MTTPADARAIAFLKNYDFDLDTLDADALLEAFLADMKRGLEGHPDALPMIPAYVAPAERIPSGRPVIVVDAGGTHLRVALARFDDKGRICFEHFERYAMPATDGPLDADEFFERLASHVRPLAHASDRIGLCFSYPTEVTPDCDGRLIRWTKQVQAPGVVGRMIGQNLLAHLGADPGRHRLTLLNDTVATLLAGAGAGSVRRCATYVGFILGTGTNTAYIESNAAIRKCPDLDPEGFQAINVESGSFAHCPRSRFDLALDDATVDTGAYAFEKMISGAYMGGVGLMILRQAAREGFFSPMAAALFSSWERLTTKEMDDFLGNPFVDNVFASTAIKDTDRRMAMALCAPVVERAALLTAVNIAAAVLKSGVGRDPLYPVCVNIDGSTYYRTNGLSSLVEAHLRRMLSRRGVFMHAVRIEDSPMVGAAVAGLVR